MLSFRRVPRVPCHILASAASLYNSVTYDDYRPFRSDDTTISTLAEAFVDGLLNKDPSNRLGSSKQRNAVQDHLWLSSLNENELRERIVEAPWIPELRNAEDAGMFDDWTSSLRPSESFLNQKKFTSLTAKEQERFNAFDDA